MWISVVNDGWLMIRWGIEILLFSGDWFINPIEGSLFEAVFHGMRKGFWTLLNWIPLDQNCLEQIHSPQKDPRSTVLFSFLDRDGDGIGSTINHLVQPEGEANTLGPFSNGQVVNPRNFNWPLIHGPWMTPCRPAKVEHSPGEGRDFDSSVEGLYHWRGDGFVPKQGSNSSWFWSSIFASKWRLYLGWTHWRCLDISGQTRQVVFSPSSVDDMNPIFNSQVDSPWNGGWNPQKRPRQNHHET